MRCDQLGDQSCPTGLMRRANAATVVAVKILIELHVVAEMRVGLQFDILTIYWPATVSIP